MFQALYSINYVKSVGVTNLFLLQYRAPPELTEFKKRQILILIWKSIGLLTNRSKRLLPLFLPAECLQLDIIQIYMICVSPVEQDVLGNFSITHLRFQNKRGLWRTPDFRLFFISIKISEYLINRFRETLLRLLCYIS